MDPRKLEWMLVIALAWAFWFRHTAWSPPADLSRGSYIELLVAAERAGHSPREQALAQGLTDEQLGRAAYHWGDLASERAVAGILSQGSTPSP